MKSNQTLENQRGALLSFISFKYKYFCQTTFIIVVSNMVGFSISIVFYLTSPPPQVGSLGLLGARNTLM